MSRCSTDVVCVNRMVQIRIIDIYVVVEAIRIYCCRGIGLELCLFT